MATPTTLPASFVAGAVLTAQQQNDLRGAFRILQVVSTTLTTTFSASVATTANTAITGLSVAITPSSTTSKVLVLGSVSGSVNQLDAVLYLTLLRGATPIGVGTSVGSRQAVTTALNVNQNASNLNSASFIVLDSPATTSATTYSVNMSHQSGSTRTLYINRTETDTDSGTFPRAVSTISVYEVSA